MFFDTATNDRWGGAVELLAFHRVPANSCFIRRFKLRPSVRADIDLFPLCSPTRLQRLKSFFSRFLSHLHGSFQGTLFTGPTYLLRRCYPSVQRDACVIEKGDYQAFGVQHCPLGVTLFLYPRSRNVG